MTPQDRKAVAQRALGLVDLTDLNENCDHQAIEKLCQRAQTPFGPVAAICIWPRFIAHARKQLSKSGIPIATVVNFPGGNQDIDITIAETQAALEDGGDEIDLVMPYRALLSGNADSARAMIKAIKGITADRALLKVILETGELDGPDTIRAASKLAIDSGADFIKTSTGKVSVNATLETAEIMLSVIRDSQQDIGFKPAGGIKSTEDCAAYLQLADSIMGDGWATNRTFRFGASSVLDDLLAALEGGNANTTDGY